MTIENWENEAWVNFSRVVYSYEGGRATETRWLMWDGTEWVNQTRTLNEYEGGLLVRTQNDQWENGAWEPVDLQLYTYSSGNLEGLLYQEWDGTQWVNNERTTVTTSNGQIVESQSDVWDGSNWEPFERMTLEQEGDDVFEVYQEWSGTEWVNTERTIYTDLTLEELNDWFEQFLETPFTQFFTGLGVRLPDMIQQIWYDDGFGGSWLNETRLTTELDAQERISSSTWDTWMEGSWLPETRYLYTYDNSHLTVVENEVHDGEDWTTFTVATYEYDQNDNISVVTNQFDFGFGLTNSSRYVFDWTSTVAVGKEIPQDGFLLEAAYPNPFNPATRFTYHVPGGYAALKVYNAVGRHVATLAEGVHAPGAFDVLFDGAGLPSGHYLIRLEGLGHSSTRTVTLLK